MRKPIILKTFEYNSALKAGMFVTVDNEHPNGGYLAEIKEVTPKGMFSRIFNGESEWDIMSNRLLPVLLYGLMDGKISHGDWMYIKDDSGKIYMEQCPKFLGISYVEKYKIIAKPDQIQLSIKQAQEILDNDGNCFIEWENNQCDGCRAGIPIERGNCHRKVNDPRDLFGISCTAHLYDVPKLMNGKVIISL